MRIHYFTYNDLPKACLYLNERYIGTYILSTEQGIANLNYDINWCHQQLILANDVDSNDIDDFESPYGHHNGIAPS